MNPLIGTGNYSATSNNEDGTLSVDGWAVTFGTTRRDLGGAATRSGPSSLYQMYVTAHPSSASVPITLSLYNGPLLRGFNVPIKELILSQELLQKQSLSEDSNTQYNYRIQNLDTVYL